MLIFHSDLIAIVLLAGSIKAAYLSSGLKYYASESVLMKRSNSDLPTSFSQVYEGAPNPVSYSQGSSVEQGHPDYHDWQYRPVGFQDWPAQLYQQYLEDLQKQVVDVKESNHDDTISAKTSGRSRTRNHRGRKMLNEIAPSPSESSKQRGKNKIDSRLSAAELALASLATGLGAAAISLDAYIQYRELNEALQRQADVEATNETSEVELQSNSQQSNTGLMKRSNTNTPAPQAHVYERGPTSEVYTLDFTGRQEYQDGKSWQSRHPAFHDWPADLYEQHLEEMKRLDHDDKKQNDTKSSSYPSVKAGHKSKSRRLKGRKLLDEIAPTPSSSINEEDDHMTLEDLAGLSTVGGIASVAAYAHLRHEEKLLNRHIREQKLRYAQAGVEGPSDQADAHLPMSSQGSLETGDERDHRGAP